MFNDFDTNVEPVFFVSGTTTRTFAKVVDDEDIHGIGIVGVGPGDLPETIPIYPDSIRKAVSLHKPILVLAQCIKGGKSKADYRVGKWPLELGAISGGDMTIQSGIHKLMYALGLAKASGVPDSKRIDFVKKVIEKNHAGELNLGP